MLAILLFVVVLSLTGCPGATAATPINQAPMTDPAIDPRDDVPEELRIKPPLVAIGYWALCDQRGSCYSARMTFTAVPSQMHDCQVAMWALKAVFANMFPSHFLYRSECLAFGQAAPDWWLGTRSNGSPT